MTSNGRKLPKEEESIVEALIRSPRRNLERKIAELESDIRRRQTISNEILSSLGTHRLQLIESSERMRYFNLPGGQWQSRLEMKKQLQKIEESITHETVLCLKDMSWLREKLREAEAALEKQELRGQLFDLESPQD